MKKSSFFLLYMLTMFFVSCSNTADDPKATLSSFFDALAKKDFVTAKKLATTESKSMLDFMETGMKADDKNNSQENEYDKSKMEFGEAVIEGDKATVAVKEKKSGETVKFTLKKENGNWKVAFDKMTMIGMGMEKAGENGLNTTDSLNKVIENLSKLDADSLKKGLDESLKKLDSVGKELQKMEGQ